MSRVQRRIQEHTEQQLAEKNSAENLRRAQDLLALQPVFAQNGRNLSYIEAILGTHPSAIVEHLARTRFAHRFRDSFTMDQYRKGIRNPDELKHFKVAQISGGWVLHGTFEATNRFSNTCEGEYPSKEPTIWRSRGNLLLTSAGYLYKPGQFFTPAGVKGQTFGVVEGTGTHVNEALPTTVDNPADAIAFFEGVDTTASHAALSARLYEIATSGIFTLDGSNFEEL